MQTHPEIPNQGFQYRENTVSLHPLQCSFSPLYEKQITWVGFYGNEVNESMNKFLMNAATGKTLCLNKK